MSACGLAAAACMQFGPLETWLDPDERGQNEHNIARIERHDGAGTFRFAVVADSHDDVDGIVLVGEALASVQDLAFVVHAGDFTEAGLRSEYRWTLAALRALPVPFVSVIGNHDAQSNGRTLYRTMFGPFDFSFRVGALRFVCFNSNGLEFGEDLPDVSWVRAAIAADDDGVVLVTHHGPESSTGGAGSSALEGLVAEPHVLASLHAHDHVGSTNQVAGRPLIGTAALQEDRRFVLVTVRGDALSFERCTLAECQQVSP